MMWSHLVPDPFVCVEDGIAMATPQGARLHEGIVHQDAQTMWRLSEWPDGYPVPVQKEVRHA